MRNLRLLTAAVLIPIALVGCSGLSQKMNETAFGPFQWCVIGGLVAGGVAGGVTGDAGAAAIGAVSGAVLGQLACGPTEPAWKDSDGDGVPDHLDKCPGTPPEAHGQVDEHGCPRYTDADDVPDYLDQCPATPAGVRVDDKGCPLDSDGDGVPDYLDKCPNTPRGVKVDGNGCPEVIAITANVNFDFDSDRIRADATSKLATVIEILKEAPQINVRVVGHTDSTGPDGYNQALSERRAASVLNYLAERGISRTRMSASGMGESNPLVPNTTKAGRAVNRRVEFEVVR